MSSDHSSPELKPCPLTLCGGAAMLVFAATGGAYIECQNCGLTTRVVSDENVDDENAKLVTALWNTRASIEASGLDEALKVIEAMADALTVADNAFATGFGIDTPKEWPRALRKVTNARTRFQP